METITKQRHEHLTEEEKKISTQIRTVAATLYEKVDLDKPTVEFLRDVVGHLELYRTHVLSYSIYVLLYRTMVLMARLTKVRR